MAGSLRGPSSQRSALGQQRAALGLAGSETAIFEAATYEDADIKHTGTHITVTDVQSGRKVQLTNEQLTKYSVRQLNKIVTGFPRQTVAKLKQRRRTLKNRGYAQNCRHKRLDQKKNLERQNEQLQRENERQLTLLAELRDKVHKQMCEINLLRQQIEQTAAQQQHSAAQPKAAYSPPQPN